MIQDIEQITLFMYGVTLSGVALFYVLLFGYRKRLKVFQEMAHTLEDVLASCPVSLYGVRVKSHKEKAFFSRRLCLFFNLIPEEVSLKRILSEMEPEGGEQLKTAFQNLKKQGGSFHLEVKNLLKTRTYLVSGGRIPDGQDWLCLLWFQEVTEQERALEQAAYVQKRQEENLTIFQKALQSVELPLKIQKKGKDFFENKDWVESENKYTIQNFDFKAGDVPCQISIVQDKTVEESLKTEIKDLTQTQKRLLKEFADPVLVFSAEGQCLFANQPLEDLFDLESSWGRKGKTYAEFLEILREKGFFPTIQDFSRYKAEQLGRFATLSHTQEDFIYLPQEKVVRQMMMPFSQGGIFIRYEQIMSSKNKDF